MHSLNHPTHNRFRTLLLFLLAHDGKAPDESQPPSNKTLVNPVWLIKSLFENYKTIGETRTWFFYFPIMQKQTLNQTSGWDTRLAEMEGASITWGIALVSTVAFWDSTFQAEIFLLGNTASGASCSVKEIQKICSKVSPQVRRSSQDPGLLFQLCNPGTFL